MWQIVSQDTEILFATTHLFRSCKTSGSMVGSIFGAIMPWSGKILYQIAHWIQWICYIAPLKAVVNDVFCFAPCFDACFPGFLWCQSTTMTTKFINMYVISNKFNTLRDSLWSHLGSLPKTRPSKKHFGAHEKVIWLAWSLPTEVLAKVLRSQDSSCGAGSSQPIISMPVNSAI